MKKKILVTILVYVMCLLLAGCACKHDWVEATCTEPKTCSKCGETEGEPLGHTPGEWEIWNTDYVSTMVWLRQPCTVCGEDVSTDMKALNSLVEDGEFLFSADEFTDRLGYMFQYYINQTFATKIDEDEGAPVACAIENDSGSIAATALFADKSDNLIAEKYDRNISKIIFGFVTEDSDEHIRIIVASILAADPALEFDDAKDVCAKLIVNGNCTKNDIRYALGKLDAYDGLYVMTITLS